jgi:hypothetical protein
MGYDIIKRSEHNTSLLDIMRSEQTIMNMYYVHDLSKIYAVVIWLANQLISRKDDIICKGVRT